MMVRWPTSITAKLSFSRQNSLSHCKTFFLTAKLSFSRQNFLSHGKTLFLTAKLSFSRQNSLSHGKTFFLTAKLSFSRQNFLSQGHTCLHRITLPKQDVNSFITQEGCSNISLYWVVSGSCWYTCHDPIVGSKTCHSRLSEGIIGKRGHPESTNALKVGGWVRSKAYTRVLGG